MARWLVMVSVVVLAGCGSTPGTDAGTGGGGGSSTGGGSATGGGGGSATGGGGGATGGGGGATAGWDGGFAGTLVGADAFTIARVVTGVQSEDGGVGSTRRFVTVYFDQPPVSACTSPNPPFAMVEVRVELADAGYVVPGTYPMDSTTYITRINYEPGGMALGVGGFGTTGSITISRLQQNNSAGSFTTTLALLDGGTAPLSGTWDTGTCD